MSSGLMALERESAVAERVRSIWPKSLSGYSGSPSTDESWGKPVCCAASVVPRCRNLYPASLGVESTYKTEETRIHGGGTCWTSRCRTALVLSIIKRRTRAGSQHHQGGGEAVRFRAGDVGRVATELPNVSERRACRVLSVNRSSFERRLQRRGRVSHSSRWRRSNTDRP